MTLLPLLINRAILTLTLSAGLIFPLSAEANDTRCVIRQNGLVAYSGACTFLLGMSGSFSISRYRKVPILPNITDISVDIISTDVAEVCGLTTNGVNSRWGSAVRSEKDPACWTGSDFEICAY